MFWLAAELPPDIPAACVSQAAQHYSIPTAALVAVLRQEGGRVGVAYNKQSGRYFGPAQISDKWLQTLSPWGLTATSLQHDACANVVAGAYVLAYYRAREPNWFRAIARYNVGSLNTTIRREAGYRYANAVMAHWDAIYQKWAVPS